MTRGPVYRTVVQVEVLSEGVYHSDDLAQIAEDITSGPCVGEVTVITSSELVPADKVDDELTRMGSEPEFFPADAEYDAEFPHPTDTPPDYEEVV